MTIRTVLLIQVFNHTCFRGSKVLMTLFALELGATPVTIGVLFAMYSVLPTFLSVFAGQVSDRVGFRIPMLFGSAGMLLGMLLPYFQPSIATLFVSATVIGTCYIFYTVTVQNLVGAMSGAEKRTGNYSLYALCVGVTAFLGPVFAGFSIELAGGPRTYLVMAALPIVPIVLLLTLGARARVAPPKGERGPRRGFMDLVRSPPLRRALIIAGVVETGNELGNFLLPIYGDSIGLSPSEIGLVLGSLAVALLVVRALIPMLSRRSSEAAVLCGSLALAALACMLFPFATSFWPMMLAAFLMGAGIGAGAPLSMVLVFNRSPEGRTGEAMGLRQTVNKGTEVAIPVVFGSISTVVGMLPVFWLVAALLGGGSYLMYRDISKREGS